jgi:CRP-like cAMP-binding protein
MSLLTGEPRTATVTAVIDSVVFEMMLAPLLQDRPDVVRQLGTTLIETRAQAGGTAAQRTRNLATQFRQRIYTFFRILIPNSRPAQALTTKAPRHERAMVNGG